ncbi:hypothetical protein BCU68_13070 [Vibrio sp. 10N.286.49.B3]|uniref:bifunctional diguanylate cyclase/phosphodiesterase n=1 Tax=Vibrio sp. 10N.286.49.B3 TaxID=1880855 RepID=UPI000C83BBEC|nr:GGDEF domain-containing phosphodiesterase [Vibrio sp. 10N.286.49.B3]PMH43776.1 hypothetical protein BCU68_13070 [Vibrio sp. 10N.286.49.B3]
MTVLKKLYIVLVPILILVFGISSLTVAHFIAAHDEQMIKEQLHHEVSLALVDNSYQIKLISLVMKNSITAIKESSSQQKSNDNPLSMGNILDIMKKRSFELIDNADLYVINPNFNVLFNKNSIISSDVENIPDNVYSAVFNHYASNSDKDNFSNYSSIDETIRIVRTTNMTLTTKNGKEHFILAIDIPLKSLSALIEKYNHNEYISINLKPINTIKPEHNIDDGKVIISLMDDYFFIIATIDDYHFMHSQQNILFVTAGLFFCLLVIILTLIYSIIKHQLIIPIEKLLKSISLGNLQLRHFHRSSDKNEIALLNNAYIDSLTGIKYEAEFDQLTRLANRRSFIKYLYFTLANKSPSKYAIICWDIIDFKKVNDLYGEKFGDTVLVSFANSLRQIISQQQSSYGLNCNEYSIARLSGNQFIALVKVNKRNNITNSIANLNEKVVKLTTIDKYDLKIKLASGFLPVDITDFNKLWNRCIDEIFIEGKKYEKQIIIGEDLIDTIKYRDEIEKKLIACCDNDDFDLQFMPIVKANSLEIDGAEILIRLPKKYNTIGPDTFIPIAERCKLVTRIDLWVIRKSILCYKNLSLKYGFQGTISINISALELYNRHFPETVKEILDQHSIDPSKIIIEITETTFVKSSQLTINTINSLRSFGMQVSLDDFGTGYTAFNQLLNYPVDELKIDKTFIDKILLDNYDSAMITSIISLAQSSNATTVGEGVESIKQLKYLQNVGCDKIQGYLFSKPLSYHGFLKFITRYTPDQSLINKASNCDRVINMKR